MIRGALTVSAYGLGLYLIYKDCKALMKEDTPLLKQQSNENQQAETLVLNDE